MIAVLKDDLLSIIDTAADICELDMHYLKAEFLRGGVRDLIQMAPEEEVEKVVCRPDCKYSVDYYKDGDLYCRRPGKQMEWIERRSHYCSYGECKENK